MHYDVSAFCAVLALLVTILAAMARGVERLTRIEEALKALPTMREDIDNLQMRQIRQNARLDNLEAQRRWPRHHPERTES